MKKRITSVVLALCLLLPMLPTTALAADVVNEGTCGANGDNVTWTLDSDGILTISGTGRMEDYYSPNHTPWPNSKTISSVVISNGVTNIGDNAFKWCSGLTGVDIPSSVTRIGNSVFEDCSNLTGVTIPNSVTSIGDAAFAHCSSLVGDMNIPAGVTSIGANAFCDTKISSIQVDKDNLHYVSRDGVLFTKDMKTLVAYPSGRTGTYNIPDSVTYIDDHAFSRCSSLTSVTIPNSVASIGSFAFAYCSSLTSVTIPNNVTSIKNYMFYRCDSLTTVDMPNGVSNIGEAAFRECINLTSVTIPSSVTSIGDNAFTSCSSLTSLDIPNGVTSIGNNAFSGCSGLTSMTIPSSVTDIGFSIFSGSEISIQVDEGNLHYASQDGVLFTKDMKTLVAYPGGRTGAYNIPSSVTSIEGAAFYACRGLTDVTIPSGVTSIGNNAFSWCSGLTSVIIPDSVTKIGLYAFSQCSGLISLTISNGISQIKSNAFSGCSNLARVDIPSSVTIIDYYAFEQCSKLKDVYYGGSVEDWKKISILGGNEDLTNATLHDNSRTPFFMVTFNSRGGNEISGQTVTSGGKVTKPVDPTRSGHTFGGWYKDAECTEEEKWDFGTDTVTEHTTLYAKWTKNSGGTTTPGDVTVTVDLDGGTLGDGITTLVVGSDGKVQKPAQDPVRPGYIFIGWYKDSSYTEIWDFSTHIVNSSTTIYAKWEKDNGSGGGTTTPGGDVTVTINFNGGGTLGSGTTTLVVNPNGTVQRPADPVRPGYIFINWYEDESCTKIWDFSTHIVNSNTTIYAKWEKDNGSGGGTTTEPGDITVTIDLNGGTLGSGITTLVVGADGKVERPVQDPVRPGYIFMGWYKDSSYTEIWDFSTHIVNSNTTIYAKWEKDNGSGGGTTTEPGKVTVTINFNGGGTLGSGTTTLVVGSDGKVQKPAQDPVRPGYIFMGWYEDPSYTKIWDFSTHIVNSNTTIYVKWEKDTGGGTITEAYHRIYTDYYTSGGSVYMSHSSAAEGTRVTVEVSPRSGYELDWLLVYDLNTGRELTLTRRYYDTYTFSMPNGPVGVEVSFFREDIDSGSWYVPEIIPVSNKTASNKPIRWYYKNGQIWHVTDGVVPYSTLLTRDMLISILYNMDPNSTGEPLFWATQQKVMPDIYPSGLWGTDKNISREQTAMILYNYSRHMGYDLSPSVDLIGCSDYAEMRPIARTAMSWARATGLFSRNLLNTLSPKGTLTCGEMNALLSRFVSAVARTR